MSSKGSLLLALSIAAFGLQAASAEAQLCEAGGAASDITVVGTGSTIVIHFLEGCTEDRAATMVVATQHWADFLESTVPIEVELSFVDTLYCTPTSATLGSAGTTTVARDFVGAPRADTWYPQALANSLAGYDVSPGTADIRARFNARLDDPDEDSDCLTGVDWYYGPAPAPPQTINFHEVVLHELAHGAGFQNFANLGSTGARFLGRDDHYLVHLFDQDAGRTLSGAEMSDSERAAAAVNTGDLVWNGHNANLIALETLTNGVSDGAVRMYAPNPYRGGSSVSHFDTVVTPNEVMEPFATGTGTTHLTEALFNDLGWGITTEPEITGQTPISGTEDTLLPLDLSMFTVSDPDSSYPADFSLRILESEDYEVDGLSIMPKQDLDGPIEILVQVNDGTLDSDVFAAAATLASVNDAPEIADTLAVSVPEDGSVVIDAGDFLIDDPDDDTHDIELAAGDHFEIAGTTVSPDANYHGTIEVPARVFDGESYSAWATLSITVTPVNDPPTILTSSLPADVPEDSHIPVAMNDLTVSDIDSAYPESHHLIILPGDHYSINAATVMLEPNYVGPVSIGLRVSDGALLSAVYTHSLTVTPVNDPPVITGAGPISILEDEAYVTSLADLQIEDPDDTSFSLEVGPGTNYVVQGSNVVPFSHYAGTLNVPVRVSDGAATSPWFNLSVEVTPVNDMPTIASAATIQRDAEGLYTGLGEVSPPFARDEEDGTLTAALHDAPSVLRPGRHVFEWVATDAMGVEVRTDQIIEVRPLASIDAPASVREGGDSLFRIWLNGDAPYYPYVVHYEVVGDGHSLDSVGSVVFDEGEHMVEVPFSVGFLPSESVAAHLEIRLASSANAGPQASATLQIAHEDAAQPFPLDLAPLFEDADGDGITDTLDTWSLPFAMSHAYPESVDAPIHPIEAAPGQSLFLPAPLTTPSFAPEQVVLRDDPESSTDGGAPYSPPAATDTHAPIGEFVDIHVLTHGDRATLVFATDYAEDSSTIVTAAPTEDATVAYLPLEDFNMKSAHDLDGTCPPPGSSAYQIGLRAGERCVEVTLLQDDLGDIDLEDPNVIHFVGGRVAWPRGDLPSPDLLPADEPVTPATPPEESPEMEADEDPAPKGGGGCSTTAGTNSPSAAWASLLLLGLFRRRRVPRSSGRARQKN